MQKWVTEFWSGLHRDYLQKRGFRKTEHTFSRDKGTYWERFNIQGSSWNRGEENEAWSFYINVGIYFKEVPEGSYWGGFPSTHWGVRIASILPDMPDTLQLPPHPDSASAESLLSAFERASQTLDFRISEIYDLLIKREWDGISPFTGQASS